MASKPIEEYHSSDSSRAIDWEKRFAGLGEKINKMLAT
jgi:hypothetical protein